MVQLSHPDMTTGKTIALTRRTFVGKVMSLLFSVLSRLVIAFLRRSKCLLISWLQSPFAVILESRKIKSVIVSIVSPSICHEVMGLDAIILVFWMLSFKQLFHSPFSPSSRGSLVPFCFLPSGWCHLPIWGYWYFSWQSWFRQWASSSLAFFIIYSTYKLRSRGFPGGSVGKESTCDVGDPGFDPWVGNSNILTWRIPWTAKSQRQLSDFD